ncbi:unnamed protein product [Anisakis simplex]|uniref:Calmodulin n=1 Tax=Anisakis simplex TaxID=6269 RepID=A0A158PNG5_ANISI|nr:unnamed protein product [Anisakis simplex]
MYNRSMNEELSIHRHSLNNTGDVNQSGLLASHESTMKWKLRQEARNKLLQTEAQKIPSDEDIDAFGDLLKSHCQRTSTDDVELIRYDEYRKAIAEVHSELLRAFIPSNLFMSLLTAYNDDQFGRIPVQVVIDYLRLRKDKMNKIITLNYYDSNGKGYLTDEDLNDYISEEYMSRSPVITLLEMETALWDENCIAAAANAEGESKRQRDDSSEDKSDKGNDKSDDKDGGSESDEAKVIVSLGSAVSEQTTSNCDKIAIGFFDWRFSKGNFHRVAELYVQLDGDGNGLLDASELADFRRITNTFINRLISVFVKFMNVVSVDIVNQIFQVTQTYEKDPPKIDLRVFIDFLLGIENRSDPASIVYHFRVLDLNGDGYLDAFELKYFYDDMAVLSEQCYGVDSEMQFALPLFEDIKDEIFDMVKPKDPLRISLEELLACGQGGTICGMITDLDCLLEYENREDPGRLQEDLKLRVEEDGKMMEDRRDSAEKLKDANEMMEFHKRLVEATEKLQQQKLNENPLEKTNATEVVDNDNDRDESEVIARNENDFENDENSVAKEGEGEERPVWELPVVEYQKPLKKDPERVLYVMKHMRSMTLAEMRRYLKEDHIDSRGTRAQLMARLRKYYRRDFAIIKSDEPMRNRTERYYDYFVVMDFECTCEDEVYEYEHEIIEFPAVLVDVRNRRVVDTFRSHVRPTLNPILSEFCTKLTGITQEMVDNALPFTDVLVSFRMWMQSHRLGQENARYAFVTDGPWDIAKFFQMQCLQVGFDCYCFDLLIQFICGMLSTLGMTFEGREHCGLDDSKNIARIVIRMLEDRSELRVNEKLARGRDDSNKRQATGRNSSMSNQSKHQNADTAERRCKSASLSQGQQNVGEINENLGESKRADQTEQRQRWRDTLPLKVHSVCKDAFISGEYLDCDTCDEAFD